MQKGNTAGWRKTGTNLGLSTLYHCGTAKRRTAQRGVQDEFQEGIRGCDARGLHGQHAGFGAVGSRPPLSVAARSGATTEDDSELRGGFIIPAVAVVAIILGILALTGGGDDRPHSP